MKSITLFVPLLFFIIINNPTNSLPFEGIIEISKMFNKLLKNPFELLISLTANELKSTDKDFSCTLCQRLIKAVTTTIREKWGYEGLLYYGELLCSIALDRGVCETYISAYGKNFLDMILLRAANEESLCHNFGLCLEGEEVEDTYDYAIRVLKGKPKDKKREKIDETAPQLRMIQITDIHLDVKYIENGAVFCDEPSCCRTPASNFSRIKSGKFGYLGRCDTGLELLKSLMDKIYELKPDFIIWTGDNSGHNSKNSSQEENYEATIIVKDMLDERFNLSIPIYPALGNHEVFPADAYIGSEKELLEEYAEIFKDYFYEEQAYESFKKYGYYTEKYNNTNLRIVVLNCLVCDSWNFYIVAGRHQAAKDEFIWLEKVFRQAEKDGEYIYLIDHFPLNGNFQLTECAQRLRALLDRFDYLVRGYFSGHTHLDDISPVKTYFEPKPIININYIAPPVTPYPGRNPSFRQFIIDSNTKNLIDYEQYRLNLTDSNAKGVADWYITYYATQLFNVTDLTELDKIFKINVDEGYTMQRYAEGKDESKILHNKKEINIAQCQIESDTFHDFYTCLSDPIFTGNFAFELLNDLSGEWPIKDVE